MVENGQKWLTMQICKVLNAQEAKKNPGTEPKNCEKGPKLGFEYFPKSKTSHCVHGIPVMPSKRVFLRMLLLLKYVADPGTLRKGFKPREGKPSSVNTA